jgi:heme/copper-type cytochrome/quinol oxidase subunit 1
MCGWPWSATLRTPHGPDNHIVPDPQYNELFAMHGTIMLLLFAT